MAPAPPAVNAWFLTFKRNSGHGLFSLNLPGLFPYDSLGEMLLSS